MHGREKRPCGRRKTTGAWAPRGQARGRRMHVRGTGGMSAARLGPGGGPGGEEGEAARGREGGGGSWAEGEGEAQEKEGEKEREEERTWAAGRGREKGRTLGQTWPKGGRRIIFRFFFLINFDKCSCCLINIFGALKIQVKFEGSF